MTIHREGYGSLIVTVLALFVFNLAIQPFVRDFPLAQTAGWIFSGLLFLVVLQFFRYPKRANGSDEGQIISPADGKVVVIEDVMEEEYFKEKRKQVSIFMSPLNVHANWIPVEGKIKYKKYHPGRYLLAWNPKSSSENERTTFVIENDKTSILVRQIAGFLARRIVYYPEESASVNPGDELGFIKFGSRVDLLLPVDVDLKVKIGDKVVGNTTVIAQYD